MTQDNSERRARPGACPSHHISSIAHLFFDNKNDADQSELQSTDIRLLVMGSGRDTSAPYTAAGLGQHLLDQSRTVGQRGTTDSSIPIRQVFFAEPSPVRFSGVSQLQPGSFRSPVEGEFVPWPVRQNLNAQVLRIFPGEVPSEDFSGGMVQGRFFIRHQDLPGQLELGSLENQAAAGLTTGLGDDGIDGLIWCVQGAAAVSLALMSRLGRMLKIVQPREIHLLVYPDLETSQTRGASEATEALLERSRHLVRYVSGGSPVHGVLMGNSPTERTVQLAALSRRLSI